MDYTVLSWPYIGYSAGFSTGTRTSSDKPGGRDPYKGSLKTLNSALYFSTNVVEGTLFAEHSGSGDFSGVTETMTYYVGGSYYPIQGISFTPDYNFVDARYRDMGVRTTTHTAEVTLTYAPVDSKLELLAYGSYSTEENKDWSMDSKSFYATLGVDWPMKSKTHGTNHWSFLISYYGYIDDINPDATTDDVTLWLTYRNSLSSLILFLKANRSRTPNRVGIFDDLEIY